MPPPEPLSARELVERLRAEQQAKYNIVATSTSTSTSTLTGRTHPAEPTSVVVGAQPPLHQPPPPPAPPTATHDETIPVRHVATQPPVVQTMSASDQEQLRSMMKGMVGQYKTGDVSIMPCMSFSVVSKISLADSSGALREEGTTDVKCCCCCHVMKVSHESTTQSDGLKMKGTDSRGTRMEGTLMHADIPNRLATYKINALGPGGGSTDVKATVDMKNNTRTICYDTPQGKQMTFVYRKVH
ncbi:hypothetical protein NFJ02_20g42150 [Pycnococcus provasolii]